MTTTNPIGTIETLNLARPGEPDRWTHYAKVVGTSVWSGPNRDTKPEAEADLQNYLSNQPLAPYTRHGVKEAGKEVANG